MSPKINDLLRCFVPGKPTDRKKNVTKPIVIICIFSTGQVGSCRFRIFYTNSIKRKLAQGLEHFFNLKKTFCPTPYREVWDIFWTYKKHHKTNFLNIVFIGLMGAWFMWNIINGGTLMEATYATLVPLLLLMIPHALFGLLADLNQRQL